MEENGPSSLDELLLRLRFVLREPVDLRRTEPEATGANVRLLTAAATYFNVMAVTEFGGRAGQVRHPGYVEQVVAAAFQGFGDEDPHAWPFERAAMLLRGIPQGHPFTDGNKRTGFLLATYYLTRVGFRLRADLPRSDIVDFNRQVSAGEIRDIAMMSQTLTHWFEPRGKPTVMA